MSLFRDKSNAHNDNNADINRVDFFNVPNPSGLTVALGSTQPLTEMSPRNLPGG
jgi:hypothetical protein